MNKLIQASYQPGNAKETTAALYKYEAYAVSHLPAVFIPWIPQFNEHATNIPGTVRTFDPVGAVISPNYWWISQ